MIGRMISSLWERLWCWLRPTPKPYALVYVEGDELPTELPPRTLVIAHENGVLWSAGMICPCGCKRRIEVMLLPGVQPRWDLTVEPSGRPSLKPSIWVNTGCRAHFWLVNGQIRWAG